MAHLILEGFPGYRLEMPDDEYTQTTLWFAQHLLDIARERNRLAVERSVDLGEELQRRLSSEDK